MTELFLRFNPEMIGNDYLIMGTVERKIWSEGMKEQIYPSKILPQMSGFINYYKELRMTQPGWYPANQEPPVMEPPKSQDWIKSKPEHLGR